MGIFNSLKRALNRGKSMQIESTPIEITKNIPETPSTSRQSSSVVEIEKDSLQLGMAAGYTGRSLRTIESTLIRLESVMVTKDWLAAEVLPMLHQLKDKTNKIDIIEYKLNEISNDIIRLRQSALNLSEPARTSIQKELGSIENLTWRMKEILEIVKERGEISYEDLSTQLNYNDKSALRSMLTTMVKRTDKIERFERENKGWVKYIDESNKANDELNRTDSMEIAKIDGQKVDF